LLFRFPDLHIGQVSRFGSSHELSACSQANFRTKSDTGKLLPSGGPLNPKFANAAAEHRANFGFGPPQQNPKCGRNTVSQGAVHLTAMGLRRQGEPIMRIALLTGAAALVLAGTAGARAETIYVTEPDTVVAPGYVYGEPSYVVRERSFVVAGPPRVVVAPPAVVAPRVEVQRRERVVVVPRREREIVVEQPAYTAPRDSSAYRGTWRGGAWRGNGGYVTTSYSSGRSCAVDINGFERCY
jgi:hypothetical protein